VATLKCDCGKKADIKEGGKLLCHDCYFKEKGVKKREGTC